MIRLIVFDFDGVIVRSTKAHIETWMKVMKKRGISCKLTEQVIKENFGKSYDEIARSILPEESFENRRDVMAELMKELTAPDYPSKLNKLEGIEDFLSGLKKRGILIAVATGNKREVMEFWLKELGLAGMFNMILTPDDIKRGKPYPDMLAKMASYYKVKKEDMLYVGDAPDDIRMGKAAGVKTVAVLTGAMSRKDAEDEGADIIIDKVTDLKV
ncbi:MAG: HAD family phosphatase [Candidatus Aenigmatarchaeota archaeon]